MGLKSISFWLLVNVQVYLERSLLLHSSVLQSPFFVWGFRRVHLEGGILTLVDGADIFQAHHDGVIWVLLICLAFSHIDADVFLFFLSVGIGINDERQISKFIILVVLAFIHKGVVEVETQILLGVVQERSAFLILNFLERNRQIQIVTFQIIIIGVMLWLRPKLEWKVVQIHVFQIIAIVDFVAINGKVFISVSLSSHFNGLVFVGSSVNGSDASTVGLVSEVVLPVGAVVVVPAFWGVDGLAGVSSALSLGVSLSAPISLSESIAVSASVSVSPWTEISPVPSSWMRISVSFDLHHYFFKSTVGIKLIKKMRKESSIKLFKSLETYIDFLLQIFFILGGVPHKQFPLESKDLIFFVQLEPTCINTKNTLREGVEVIVHFDHEGVLIGHILFQNQLGIGLCFVLQFAAWAVNPEELFKFDILEGESVSDHGCS